MKFNKVVLAVLVVASFNASAINSHYRDQLIKSGCDQLTVTQGCDIHKTKAENQKNFHPAKDPEHAQEAAFIESVVLGNTIDAAAEALLQAGWKPNNGIWTKSRFKLHLTVNENTKRVVLADLKDVKK